MKIKFTLIFIFVCQLAIAQQQTVELKLRTFKSNNKNVDSVSASNDIRIANLVLNLQEFRDLLNKYDFKCKNYREKC